MNNLINDAERPRRRITGQVQFHLAYYGRQNEAISHVLGAALKRCFKVWSPDDVRQSREKIDDAFEQNTSIRSEVSATASRTRRPREFQIDPLSAH